ncbi:MAG: hypothetical protein Q8M07_18400 [Prosthecobacter sp.]|nr:hypothetical protein [Prosthecobacter sp.]
MQPPQYHDRTLEAFTLTMVNVGCLWSWTWMQFVTLYWYGIPWFAFDVESALIFYLPVRHGSLSLPELFLLLSAIGVAILVLAAVVFTRNARGRLRMLLVLAFFSTLTLGFGWKILGWWALHLETAEYEVSVTKEYLLHEEIPRYREEYRQRILRLEHLIRQAKSEQH